MKVWPERVREDQLVVRKMHRLLPLNEVTKSRELCREQAFVHGLHDAGAQVAVQQERGVHGGGCKLLDVGRGFAVHEGFSP